MANALTYSRRRQNSGAYGTQPQTSSIPENYPMSRAALRDRFGARAIKGSGENDFAPNDTTPSAMQARSSAASPLTPKHIWDQLFAPKSSVTSEVDSPLAPSTPADLQGTVDIFNRMKRPATGTFNEMRTRTPSGGILSTMPAFGGVSRRLETPYGELSSFTPDKEEPSAEKYLNRVIGGATQYLKRRKQSPVSGQLTRNTLGYDPIA